MTTPVLVTGGSGFLGLHTIIQLLERDELVRTTVRSPAREAEVRETLAHAGVEAGDRLSFVVADLLADDGWAQAVDGVEHVLHIASPFPAGETEHDDDLILPAREGTLRVLRAARDAGARRVVVTSSSAAVGHDRQSEDEILTEADWTDPAADVGAYIRSKTVAERAAWEFIDREGGGLELAAINPGAIFGPVLGADYSASIGLVAGLLGGAMSGGVPRLSFSVVDVRDVADLHLRAMDVAAAAGERFIAAAGPPIWLADVARLLRERLGDAAAHVPTNEIPDDVLRAAAVTDPSAQRIAREVGRMRHLSGDKARRVLGWTPRAAEEAILATAESLLELRGVR